jgi:hypothetical protein
MAFPHLISGDFFDSPEVLDCSANPIPANSGSPKSVVACTNCFIYAIRVLDSTNRYIGVYYGTPGQEILAAIVGGGGSSLIETYIPPGSRISLRSMDSTPVNSGSICCQFLTA